MEEQDYEEIRNFLTDRLFPTTYSKSQKKALKRTCKKYVVRDDRLYRNSGAKTILVLKGKEEKDQAFLECHHSQFGGHAGRDNTLKKIKERYFWPGFYGDTLQMLKSCNRCQRNTRDDQRSMDVLHPIKVTPEVWYLLGMDLIDAHKRTKNGNRYIMTVTDYFSKYVEAMPLPEKSAVAVAKGMFTLFCRHGSPVHVICDQGGEFVNQVSECLLKEFKVKQRISSSYHPQSNGLDERTNQTLKKILRKLASDNQENWEDFLESALFAINTNTSTTTGYSAFYLMHGRHPRMPFEADIEGEKEENMQDVMKMADEVVSLRIENLKNIHGKVFQDVDKNIKKTQEKQKVQYDKKRGNGIIECDLNTGDLVLRRNMLQKTKKGHKMEDRWLGPYKVISIDKEKGSCFLEKENGKKLKRQINIKQLKKYHESSGSPYINTQVPPDSHAQVPPDSHAQVPPDSHAQVPPDSHAQVPPDSHAQVPPDINTQVPPDSHAQVPPNSHAQVPPDSHAQVPPEPQCEQNNWNPGKIKEPRDILPSDSDSDEIDDEISQITAFNNIIKNIDEETLEAHLNIIMHELHAIDEKKEKSWYYDLASTGHSEMHPTLKMHDMGYNIKCGVFTDAQCQQVVDAINEDFPNISNEIKSRAFFPEALNRICSRALNIPREDAEKFLEKSTMAEENYCSSFLKAASIINLKKCPKKRPLKSTSYKKSKKQKTNDARASEVKLVKVKKNSSPASDRMIRPDFSANMSETDRRIITGHDVLNDQHIMVFQNILHKEFPDIEGFFSTTIGIVGQFPPIQSQRFIQILHTGNYHWVCLSNIGCQSANSVSLYDSKYSNITQVTKKQIASLLLSEEHRINVHVQPVQQQSNGVDCGVMALAFATSLYYGMDPCMLSYNRREIRHHLWQCISLNQVRPFPCRQNANPSQQLGPKTISFDIFCQCKLPQYGNMVACDHCGLWFHQHCVSLPDKFFRSSEKRSWCCGSC